MTCEKPTSRRPVSRRDLLTSGLGLIAATTLPALPFPALAGPMTDADHPTQGEANMSSITTKDGITIFYKDWGTGQPIVFSHGWPLSADDWDAQMMFTVFASSPMIAAGTDARPKRPRATTWIITPMI